MSKKKSYMDIKNILSEGFFSDLKKYLKGKKNLTRSEKKAMKDPKVKKVYLLAAPKNCEIVAGNNIILDAKIGGITPAIFIFKGK